MRNSSFVLNDSRQIAHASWVELFFFSWYLVVGNLFIWSLVNLAPVTLDSLINKPSLSLSELANLTNGFVLESSSAALNGTVVP